MNTHTEVIRDPKKEGSDNHGFYRDILTGLSHDPKYISPKFLYDEIGSQLFNDICNLNEYYLSRTELDIMRENIGEISLFLGLGCRIVELGSGSGVKTRVLLDGMMSPKGYVPVDIADEQLSQSAANLESIYPDLIIKPVVADFTFAFDVPLIAATRTVVFFPGSTIGNLEPSGAIELFQRMAGLSGKNGGLLIGVDLKKDRQVLERAYNDRDGVTKAFNLNLLTRINRAFGTSLSHSVFRHQARYDEEFGRIEMSLISLIQQQTKLNGQSILFSPDERIITEYSYKYTLEEFAELASQGGWQTIKVWTDPDRLFSVHYLVPG
jgi:L-histidine N-alpha-methyltransferase